MRLPATNRLDLESKSPLKQLANKRTKCPNNPGNRVEPPLVKIKSLDMENSFSTLFCLSLLFLQILNLKFSI